MKNNSLSNRVVKSFKLIDKNGAVIDTITIYVEIENIATMFNARLQILTEAERELRRAQKTKNTIEFDKSAEKYAVATKAFIELIFGDENTSKLFDFYDNRYIDMAKAIAPFIKKELLPAINNYKKAKKVELKNQFK